jgi:hypothetical protein
MRVGIVGLSSLLIMASAAPAIAQSSNLPMPPRRFGLLLGVNSSTLGGGDAQDASRKAGVVAGALAVLPVSPVFSFEPEILYTMKGASAHDLDDPASTGKLSMNYIEIPVLARFELAAATTGPKPYIYAGPALAFKTSCNFEVNDQGFNLSADCSQFESAGLEFKSTDFSLLGGIGVAFKTSGHTVSIAARYDHSLSKLTDQIDLKHRVISLVGTFEF